MLASEVAMARRKLAVATLELRKCRKFQCGVMARLRVQYGIRADAHATAASLLVGDATQNA
jgi:hypothetical protein